MNTWTTKPFAVPLPSGVDDNNPAHTGIVDVDGDGDLDLVIAWGRQTEDVGIPITVMLNDGAGTYTDGTATIFPGGAPTTRAPAGIVVADFNSDGRMDVYIVDSNVEIYPSMPNPGAQNRLLLSSGLTGFVDATANLPQQLKFPHSTTAGDINGDGHVDIIVGDIFGGTPPTADPYILLGDGAGNFSRSDTLLPPDVESGIANPSSILLFDADGDSDLDFVAPQSGGTPSTIGRVYINDGSGDFSSASYIELPVSAGPLEEPGEPIFIASADFDGNGFQDLIFADAIGTGRYIQLMMNYGGVFVDETATRLPQTETFGGGMRRLQIADVNNDGFLDIIARDQIFQSVFFNDGTGHFVNAPIFPNGRQYTTVTDVNGDGRSDFLLWTGRYVGPPDNANEFEIWVANDPGLSVVGVDNFLLEDADALWGDADAESFSGVEGNDVIFGGAGNDTASGDNGDDYVHGGAGDDSLAGAAGADVLFGHDGADSLGGGDGSDSLRGGGGADAMDGGAGFDAADFSNAVAGVGVNLATSGGTGGEAAGDTFVSIETVIGSDYGDTLTGSAIADNLRAGADSDTLSGGDGGDVLWGEAGDDTIDGGGGNDNIDGGDGNDLITAQSGRDTILGGLGNDSVDAAAGDDVIDGGADQDRLFGGAGSDSLIGGNDKDTLQGGTENDTLVGGKGFDFLLGQDGADSVDGGELADTLLGGNGNDVLKGGADNDRLLGEAQRDQIFGDEGDDIVDAGTGDDTVDAGTQRDSVFGGSGLDSIIGGGGNDTLQGGNDNDTLSGGAGFDILEGGAGDDTLDGGDLNDVIFGNAGNDMIVFRKFGDADTIRDFTAGAGVGDVVRLVGFGAAFDSFAEILAAASDNGVDTTINFGGGDVIVLRGVLVSQLAADDFTFA
jgi:Ca2+-binding RTX toxin-like protein